MSTRAKKIQYIRDNFTLTQLPDGTWEARAIGYERTGRARLVGTDRAEVIRQFRAYWGHFNHADEIEAFNEIFK